MQIRKIVESWAITRQLDALLVGEGKTSAEDFLREIGVMGKDESLYSIEYKLTDTKPGMGINDTILSFSVARKGNGE